MAVELGRTWCVRHGNLRFASFQAAAAEQQCLIEILVRGGRRHHEPHYNAVLACVEGTAPAGSSNRGQRRRATGRRRAGKRWLELSVNEIFYFSDQHRKLRGEFCFFGTGEKGNRLELSVNESKCERAGRVS